MTALIFYATSQENVVYFREDDVNCIYKKATKMRRSKNERIYGSHIWGWPRKARETSRD